MRSAPSVEDCERPSCTTGSQGKPVSVRSLTASTRWRFAPHCRTQTTVIYEVGDELADVEVKAIGPIEPNASSRGGIVGCQMLRHESSTAGLGSCSLPTWRVYQEAGDEGVTDGNFGSVFRAVP